MKNLEEKHQQLLTEFDNLKYDMERNLEKQRERHISGDSRQVSEVSRVGSQHSVNHRDEQIAVQRWYDWKDNRKRNFKRK